MLSEISKDYKEKAILIYKFFKYYFIEKEKIFIEKIKIKNDKLDNFKQICNVIINSENKSDEDLPIEFIIDTLERKPLTDGNKSFI